MKSKKKKKNKEKTKLSRTTPQYEKVQTALISSTLGMTAHQYSLCSVWGATKLSFQETPSSSLLFIFKYTSLWVF